MTPVVVVWSLQQTITRRGGLTYLLERFGFANRTARRATPVWFHAASVGEMRLATPLISEALEHGVLVTCNTPEAYRLASATFNDKVTIRYCPLDYPQSVKIFIKQHQPSSVFVVETEVWPELYEQCHRDGVAIHIVNGRISDKTFRSVLARRWLYPGALKRVTAVWAREAGDAKRFVAMGCPPEKVHFTGSLKMTRRVHERKPENPLPHRDFTLAISTHPGEERIITEVWRGVSSTSLLVLIPRHPPRVPSIIKALESDGFKVGRTSSLTAVGADMGVLVVDTIGEVDAYCAHASFVFVGGSMIDAGGHNVFEPLSWGKAIIVGPYTQNFTAEVEYLISKQAISIVETDEALYESWQKLAHDLVFRERLEACAREAYSALPDRVGDYIALINQAVKARG